MQATSAASVITITAADPAAPFTLACSVTAGAETYTAAGPFPETATATVSGTIPAGAMLTTTINTLPLAYHGRSRRHRRRRIAAAIAAADQRDDDGRPGHRPAAELRGHRGRRRPE